MGRVILEASPGMVLTDGVLYGERITLGEERSASDFHEITRAEYEAIVESEEATEADYQAALAEFGVKI